MKGNGQIKLDSVFGKELGFTSDLFDGYLWKKNNEMWISFINSKKPRNGNLSKLFDELWSRGFVVCVPTPSVLMSAILIKKGFKQTFQYEKVPNEDVEVWKK